MFTQIVYHLVCWKKWVTYKFEKKMSNEVVRTDSPLHAKLSIGHPSLGSLKLALDNNMHLD